jgi:hypothetical protein
MAVGGGNVHVAVRRDPDGKQPGQLMTAPAPLARIRDLGEELESAHVSARRMALRGVPVP